MTSSPWPSSSIITMCMPRHGVPPSSWTLVDTPGMGFEPYLRASKLETANEFVTRMKETLAEARSALAKAKDDMVKYYDRRRLPTPTYKPGDQVFLDSSDIRTTRPSKKLAHKYLGPFKITSPVGTHAYRLALPASMSRVHPVFHVAKLLPVPEDVIEWRRNKNIPPTSGRRRRTAI